MPAERGETDETGKLRVLDRTTQVLHAAAETVRPGAVLRRARRALSWRHMSGAEAARPGAALRRVRRALSWRRVSALLEIWLKRAGAAAVGAGERIGHFFGAA